ncbi:MAG: peptidogalycan biosysnthesis protein, partial [Pseudolabrys sp.]
MTDIELRIRIAQSLAEIPATAWDACTGAGGIKVKHEDNLSPGLPTQAKVDNPFISHDFLSSLEESFSVGPRTGWQPRHLLAEAA